METTGYWEKISGARAVFIPCDKTFDAGLHRSLHQELVSQNTRLTWLGDQYLHLSSLPQYRYRSMAQHVSARKRPSTDTTLTAGGKRSFSRTETNPVPTLKSMRKENLDDFFNSIVLEKADKVGSKRLVDQILKATVSRLVSYNGGQIYSRQYIDAGSYPVKMKISKADEFDVNIPLNITAKTVRTHGKVSYHFDNINQTRYGVSSLKVDQQLFYDPEGIAIPLGYAVVDVEMGCNRFCRQFILERKSLPRKFLHSNLQTPRPNIDRFHTYRSARQWGMLLFNPTMMGSNESIRQLGCVELIPLDVKKDLFEKLTVALSQRPKIWNQNVNISRACHGPALKMTIKPGRGSPVQHDISVDISVSLHCDIPLTSFGWPREETRRAFSMEHINEVLKAGIHLVPKKDLFWAISFSKAERALLSRLDTDQGCRKYVAKIMKKHVMTCSSQSSNGLPGISSHIIKTQILWSCEKHHNCPYYWYWGNRDICLINTMKELENTLISKEQPDYFYPAVDILEDKEAAVLTKLAEFIQKRRNELENMK